MIAVFLKTNSKENKHNSWLNWNKELREALEIKTNYYLSEQLTVTEAVNWRKHQTKENKFFD